MGNEAAKQALLELNSHSLQELERQLKEKQSRSRSFREKHGWDANNTSSNIIVSQDCLTIKRGSGPKQSDVARGCAAYTKDIHFFEFQWNPGVNKKVAIGIVTAEAKLKTEEGSIILGADDKSVGFDLVTREVFFNGERVKRMVKNKKEDYNIPDKITMVLDMNKGTLAFMTSEENLGMAMKGLKHLSENIYIAGELDEAGDKLTIKYLGQSEKVSKDIGGGSSLCFHECCGKNVILQDSKRRAMRRSPKLTFAHATALTSRPLNNDEMFKVLLVSKDESHWMGSWNIGVTIISPQQLDFRQEMSSCKQGKCIVLEKDHTVINGDEIEKLKIDIDTLETGSTVGVKKRANTVMFYVDGAKVASVAMEEDVKVYGFVDVYGQATEVMIIDDSANMKDAKHSPSAKSAAGTSEEYLAKLHAVVDMMKSPKKETMDDVLAVLKHNLDDMYHKIKDKKIRQLAADKLAKMDAAKVFTEYLKFLMKQDPENNERVAAVYETLMSVCWNYSDNSLLLAKKFGEAGLLDILIDYIKANSKTYKRNKVTIISVLSCFGILHNCAKNAENKPIYRKKNFMTVSRPYCDANTTIKEIAMPAIFTKSYVFNEDEIEELKIPEPTVQDVVNTLGSAVHTEDTHQYDGWHAYELAVGITNLAIHPTNLKYFVQKGAVEKLVVMLDFEKDYEKECALNAVWSLTNDSNKQEISSTGDLSKKLGILEASESDNVKQAAIRLRMKFKVYNVQKADKLLRTQISDIKCEYKDLCRKYKDSLQLSSSYFEEKYDICFCAVCHGGREEATKYTRGVPPKEYGVPVSWYRFGLRLPPKADALNALNNWHRAFHGTKDQHIKAIMDVGELVPAGRSIIGGKKVIEQPGHYNENYKPDGFNTKQIFLSPSIRYAGVDAYAVPSNYTDPKTNKKYIAKVAYQVLIEPDSYEVGPETVGAITEIDPGFSNQELEWSTERQGSNILYGLLVKLE